MDHSRHVVPKAHWVKGITYLSGTKSGFILHVISSAYTIALGTFCSNIVSPYMCITTVFLSCFFTDCCGTRKIKYNIIFVQIFIHIYNSYSHKHFRFHVGIFSDPNC